MREEEQTPEEIEARTGAGARVRVMVAIGINPSTDRLLRRAAKLADGLEGELFAIHIRPSRSHSNVSAANVEWHLEKARQIGAQVEIVTGDDIARALVQEARARGITHLVIGQSDISRWQEAVRGSIVNRILRFRSGIDLYIVTDPGR